MKKIFVPAQNVSDYKNAVLVLVNDLTVSNDKTWARSRALMSNGSYIDALFFGKKSQDGKTLPIDDAMLDIAKKGMAIHVPHAFLGVNPTEKDGKTYENKSIRFTEWEPKPVEIMNFSGRVVGDIKSDTTTKGTPVHEFRLAQYRGKNEDGSYKPSHFETVRIYGELPAIVKNGAQLVVEGPYLANPRDVEANNKKTRYENQYIVARTIKENKPFFLILDDDNNVVGKEPYVEQPQSETEQAAAAAPVEPTEPTYEPAPVADDMPY